jgi:hypothetical protein
MLAINYSCYAIRDSIVVSIDFHMPLIGKVHRKYSPYTKQQINYSGNTRAEFERQREFPIVQFKLLARHTG